MNKIKCFYCDEEYSEDELIKYREQVMCHLCRDYVTSEDKDEIYETVMENRADE